AAVAAIAPSRDGNYSLVFRCRDNTYDMYVSGPQFFSNHRGGRTQITFRLGDLPLMSTAWQIADGGNAVIVTDLVDHITKDREYREAIRQNAKSDSRVYRNLAAHAGSYLNN